MEVVRTVGALRESQFAYKQEGGWAREQRRWAGLWEGRVGVELE